MQLSLRSTILLLGLASACAGPAAPVAPGAAGTPQPVSGQQAVLQARMDRAEASERAGAPPEVVAQAPLRDAQSESGRYTLRWRPLAPEVPSNEPFELEFFLERDGARLPGAVVVVRGWMPEHGHGMVRRPEVTDRGDGSYLVRGMLLHMGGFWELFFDVYEPEARKDRVRFEVRL